MKPFRLLPYLYLCLLMFFSTPGIGDNAVISVPVQPIEPIITPAAPNIDASSYILIDGVSGKILAEKNPDKRLAPASLTKLMSLYIISNALKNGSIHWDDKVRISTKAWKVEGSRMFVKADEEVPVKDLLRGIIVASGNDATVALAEYLAGTEEAFVSMMNTQAQALGMHNSHFIDSTGLPNSEHYATAHDLALLTAAYINNFPEDYRFFGEKWFTYHGIRQPNRNRLLWRFPSADGLKTGHTDDAGFCLVGSAKKDKMRLISVIMGAPSDLARTEDSIRLLTYGFRFFETHHLYTGNQPLIHARIWRGQNKDVPLGIAHDLYVTIPVGQYTKLHPHLNVPFPLMAPITQHKNYGTLDIVLNNAVILSEPLIALDNDASGNLWRRISDVVQFNIQKYFSKNNEKANTS